MSNLEGAIRQVCLAQDFQHAVVVLPQWHPIPEQGGWLCPDTRIDFIRGRPVDDTGDVAALPFFCPASKTWRLPSSRFDAVLFIGQSPDISPQMLRALQDARISALFCWHRDRFQKVSLPLLPLQVRTRASIQAAKTALFRICNIRQRSKASTQGGTRRRIVEVLGFAGWVGLAATLIVINQGLRPAVAMLRGRHQRPKKERTDTKKSKFSTRISNWISKISSWVIRKIGVSISIALYQNPFFTSYFHLYCGSPVVHNILRLFSILPRPETLQFLENWMNSAKINKNHVRGRILHVCGSLGPGGAERQMMLTVTGLAARSIKDLFVLCDHLMPNHPSKFDFYLEPVIKSGVKIRQTIRTSAHPQDYETPIDAAEKLLMMDPHVGFIAGIADYYREILRLKPEIVHVWLDYNAMRAGVAAILAGVPKIIVSGRNLNPKHFVIYVPYMDDIYRIMERRLNVTFLNNSRAGADDYAQWLSMNPTRFAVIRNGIDETAWTRASEKQIKNFRTTYGIPLEAPLVGAMFRIAPEKDPVLWVRTAREILDQRPDCYFLMFGAGPLRNRVEKIAARLALGSRLIMPGVTADAATAFSAFDVMLMTSHAEGTPNVLIEAQAVGTPVVTTIAGGAAETLIPGQTGYVVQKRHPGLLADSVVRLLNNRDLRQRCLTEGPRFIRQRYGLERMINDTLRLYQRPFTDKRLQPPITTIPNKYLFVHGTLGPGGSQRQFVTMITGVSKIKSKKIHVVCQNLKPWPPEENDFFLGDVLDSGATVSEIITDRSMVQYLAHIPDQFKELIEKIPDNVLWDITAMAIEIAMERPEIVVSYLDHTNIQTGVAAAMLGIPRIILSCRSVSPKHYPDYGQHLFDCYSMLATLPNVTMLHNSMAGAADYAAWLGISVDRFHIHYNGIKTDLFDRPRPEAIKAFKVETGIPVDALVVGSIFRFSEEKRPVLWVETIARVVDQVPNAHAVILGSGILEGEMRARAHELGISGRLHLPGILADPRPAYAAMDVFLLSSNREGLPNVVIEAQAQGVAVVAPNVGGVAECVDHDRSGIIVPADDPAGLANAVVTFLKAPALRRQAAECGPHFVAKRFSVDRAVSEMVAFCEGKAAMEPNASRKSSA